MKVLLFLFGCTTQQSNVPPITRQPNLVLITLDTTRQDRIGVYGYTKAQTPTIDKIASQGIRFESAYATVPLTIPSHASILTGLYPPNHGIRNNGDAILAEELTTLAEVLQQYDYHTVASVSAFVTTDVWNLDQGFNTYYDDLPKRSKADKWGQERNAESVVNDLLNDLSTTDKPFFGAPSDS